MAALLALLFVLLGLGLAAASRRAAMASLSWPDVALALTFPAVGVLIAYKRPDNLIGALLCAAGFFSAVNVGAGAYADAGLAPMHHLPAAVFMAWLSSWAWLPSLLFSSVFLLLLFPDGTLPGPRWRWPARVASVATSVLVLGAALNGPDLLDRDGVHNPIGVQAPPAVGAFVGGVAAIGLMVSIVSAVAAVVVRYRRADTVQRRQLWWFTYACVLFIALLALSVAGVVPGGALAFGPALIAASVAIAVVRYRLYDIDVIVSRSIVYAGLTLGVVAVYVTVVGFLTHLLDREPGLAGSLVATGVVAVGFQPARVAFERWVNRRIFGDRGDPYAAMSRLSQRLQHAGIADELLPAIADTIADAMRVSYVALELETRVGAEIVAAHGEPVSDVVRVPATFRGEVIGALVVAARGTGGALVARDRRLLEDLAAQAGVVMHAAELAIDLQRSREELVATREEERRRLRRDLHDGLGPTLAGVALRLGAMRRSPRVQDDTAAELGDVQSDVYAAIADIRTLVQNLRPPALDDHGLAGAIEQHAAKLLTEDAEGAATLEVTVTVDGDLTGLPAAVEVAAYRIALEAITNVLRHARARRCTVTLSRGDDLDVEVVDDGRGLPDDPVTGVGLVSMRERVAELGGRLTIGSDPRTGMRVSAHLPISPPIEQSAPMSPGPAWHAAVDVS
jgi:signal transduction histidine kinase